MIRVFFALSISEQFEQTLADRAVLLREQLFREPLRWIPPQNYHVTLAFLGDVSSADIPRLAELGREVASRQPVHRLSVRGMQWFPGVHKPRLLVAALSLSPSLNKLQADLQQQLNRRGFPIDRQKFRPHISLARAARGQQPAGFELAADGLMFDADELVLFKSELHAQGSRYTPLSVELMGAGY